jgi:hypothetical protein
MKRDLTVDQWANVAASLLVSLACAAFIAAYHTRVTWWRSDVGRNLMALAAALGALFLYTVPASLWPDGCLAIVLRWVRVGLALAIAAVMVQRTRLLLRAQREHRDRTGV